MPTDLVKIFVQEEDEEEEEPGSWAYRKYDYYPHETGSEIILYRM